MPIRRRGALARRHPERRVASRRGACGLVRTPGPGRPRQPATGYRASAGDGRHRGGGPADPRAGRRRGRRWRRLAVRPVRGHAAHRVGRGPGPLPQRHHALPHPAPGGLPRSRTSWPGRSRAPSSTSSPTMPASTTSASTSWATTEAVDRQQHRQPIEVDVAAGCDDTHHVPVAQRDGTRQHGAQGRRLPRAPAAASSAPARSACPARWSPPPRAPRGRHSDGRGPASTRRRTARQGRRRWNAAGRGTGAPAASAWVIASLPTGSTP